MTEKDMKKLSRKEILELLVAQGKELQSTRQALAEANAALEQRRIAIDKAGSIAEAALQLNGVFEAAQAACRQYTENIQSLSQRQEAVCRQREADSQAKADAILERAKKYEQDTQARCAEMTRKAKAQADAYWDQVSNKLNTYLSQHTELRQLLTTKTPKK